MIPTDGPWSGALFLMYLSYHQASERPCLQAHLFLLQIGRFTKDGILAETYPPCKMKGAHQDSWTFGPLYPVFGSLASKLCAIPLHFLTSPPYGNHL
ncbi:hypothetical protein DSO57_1002675 [Entomophthora muscae]|uniref:Uncharacterized protein n=1 Tax=Entomophthora muscae TaxID=34485 RepID=A0ACC2UJ82_9FUNG|nr:hypothetical protein DSO57_1002675 [Entomophthora muscae]